MSNDFSRQPLGYSVVVALPTGHYTIGHVKVQPDLVQKRILVARPKLIEDKTNWQVALSGNWVIEANDLETLNNILTDHILVDFDNSDSNFMIYKDLGINTLALSTLRDACLAEFHRVMDAFNSHVAALPSKRNKLVAPTQPKILSMAFQASAVQSLAQFGKAAYSIDTPTEFQELIASCRIVKLLAEAWLAIESERTSRWKYLQLEPRQTRPLISTLLQKE